MTGDEAIALLLSTLAVVAVEDADEDYPILDLDAGTAYLKMDGHLFKVRIEELAA